MPLPQLRPPPPSTAKWDFRVGDEVEANYNDGWWEGVVTDVLGNGKFSVFFRASEDQIEFSKEDLRLHFKWVNGKWVPPVEDNENEEGKVAKFYFIFLTFKRLVCYCYSFVLFWFYCSPCLFKESIFNAWNLLYGV